MIVFKCATKLAASYRGLKARRNVGPINSPKKGDQGHVRLSNFKDYSVNSADQVEYEPTDSENEDEQKDPAGPTPPQDKPPPIVMAAPPMVMAPGTPDGSPTVFVPNSSTDGEPSPQSRAEAAKAAARARRAKKEEENLLKKAAAKVSGVEFTKIFD